MKFAARNFTLRYRIYLNDEGVIIKAVDQARRRQFDAGSDYNGLQVDLVAENGASRRHIKPQRQRATFLCEPVAAIARQLLDRR